MSEEQRNVNVTGITLEQAAEAFKRLASVMATTVVPAFRKMAQTFTDIRYSGMNWALFYGERWAGAEGYVMEQNMFLYHPDWRKVWWRLWRKCGTNAVP